MSAARIEQLKSLLSRVQERRSQPRLRAAVAPAPVNVGLDAAVGVAKTIPDLRQVNVSMPEPPAAAAALTLDEMLESPTGLVQAPPPAAPSVRATAPTVEDLAPAPAAPASAELAPSVAAAPPAPASVSSIAPSPAVAAPEPELELAPSVETLIGTPERIFETAPAVEAPLTAPSARVEAPLLSRAEPVVKVVSSPRIEAPKSFGDLLDASLSLRPR